MGRYHRLTELQVQSLLNRWQHGETIPKLARELDIHPRTISRAFRSLEIKPKTGGKGGFRPRKPPKDIDWKKVREWSLLLKPWMLGTSIESVEGKKIPTAAIAAWVPSVDPVDLTTILKGRLKAGAGQFTLRVSLSNLLTFVRKTGFLEKGQEQTQPPTATPTSHPPSEDSPNPSAS